jgi:hypothetical protein
MEDHLVWFGKNELNPLRAIMYLTLWGIWLARNLILFEVKFVPTFKFFPQVLGLLPFYKSMTRTKLPRAIDELNVHRTLPWIFFDGACNDSICGCGIILHLDERNYLSQSKCCKGGQ